MKFCDTTILKLTQSVSYPDTNPSVSLPDTSHQTMNNEKITFSYGEPRCFFEMVIYRDPIFLVHFLCEYVILDPDPDPTKSSDPFHP